MQHGFLAYLKRFVKIVHLYSSLNTLVKEKRII